MPQYVRLADPAEATHDQLVELSWRAGDLFWKLRPHQLRVYDDYRRWEANPTPSREDGALELLYALRIARRWGKTFLCCLIKVEDCLRLPGSRHTYATAYQKDIGDIIAPLIEEITADAPDDVRPKYHGTKEAEPAGYYFPNGSVLKLVGIDLHPRSLRGRASDGFVVGEAGFVRDLESTVRNIIYPQFQQRPLARMILESSAPEDFEHDFDEVFVPDARERDAFVEQTIDDNETLDPQEKAKFIRAAGGPNSPTALREYYNEQSRDGSRVVVPEFNPQVHVQRVPVPRFADCYVALDPGIRDLCAIVFAFWDFENARLVFQRDWAERNASTPKIATAIRLIEAELWEGKHPHARVPVKHHDGAAEHEPATQQERDEPPGMLHRGMLAEHLAQQAVQELQPGPHCADHEDRHERDCPNRDESLRQQQAESDHLGHVHLPSRVNAAASVNGA